MKPILDKAAIFSCCFMTLFLTNIEIPAIIAMLFAITITALSSYFNKNVSLFLCCGYLILSAFIPYLVIFIPLIAYDLSKHSQLPLRVIWLLPFLFYIKSENLVLVFSVMALSTLSFLFGLRASQGEKFFENYKSLQDMSNEQVIDFEKRNKELLELQEYEVRVATLGERNRIAREIHDNVGHLLTRSILQVSALEVIHNKNTELEGQLSDVKKTLSDAMDSIRSSVHDLHDESVDLRVGIQSLIAGFSFCPIKFVYDAKNAPKELTYCFIAVIKEGLSNIARHSNASNAVVTVLEHPAFYQLIIQDNGSGKDNTAGGIGLQNIKDRVAAFNGTCRIGYKDGFRIFISIPKAVKDD